MSVTPTGVPRGGVFCRGLLISAALVAQRSPGKQHNLRQHISHQSAPELGSGRLYAGLMEGLNGVDGSINGWWDESSVDERVHE